MTTTLFFQFLPLRIDIGTILYIFASFRAILQQKTFPMTQFF